MNNNWVIVMNEGEYGEQKELPDKIRYLGDDVILALSKSQQIFPLENYKIILNQSELDAFDCLIDFSIERNSDQTIIGFIKFWC